MKTNVIKETIAGAILTALLLGIVAMLPAFAHAETNTVTEAVKEKRAEKGMKSDKVVNLTCMQTAVDVRETAVGAAFDAYTKSVSDALKARKAALNTAWGMSDKEARSKAIKDAWKAWKDTKKAAGAKLKTDKKAAWETFRKTARETCKEVLPKEEALERDSSGSVGL